ncbi:MAG TPA: FAD:protein FMN transferase [Clostridia bacterium]|nr:FAD:protein FMN transferase [Clostridia bacterium]
MFSKGIKRVCPFITILFILIFVMTGCLSSASGEYDRNIFALDTIITFKVIGNRSAKKAMEKAIERIHEIEDHMSATIDESDVSRINTMAGQEPVAVNEDTFYVIEKALEYGKLTDGIFDITIGPIVNLWNIGSDNPKVPSEEDIEDRLLLVDYRKVIIDKNKKTVFLEDKGMKIDLGAIAKGYAADEALRILKEAGVKHALLNLGGNVLVIGGKPDGKPWRIGLQDPRTEETGHEHFAIAEVEDRTIVSSGDYERYMVDIYEKTGIRYHHIFHPENGYPAESGLMTCTIIGDSSMDADAISTIFFIMGYEKGFQFIEGLEGVEAIAVTLDKQVYTTKGLEDKLIPSNDHYRIRGSGK